MLKYSELHYGAEVYWTDPAEKDGDENHMSGYYEIVGFNVNNDTDDEDDDIVVFLKNEAGSELEAFNSELT